MQTIKTIILTLALQLRPHLMDYISSTFTLRKIVQKGDAYQDSKAPVQDGKEDTVTAVAKDDITLVERVGGSIFSICSIHT